MNGAVDHRGRVLIIAGSDSGGGAGVQADIKAVTAMGGYAATALTALTAQNTMGVHAVVGIEPAFIAQQIKVVLDDIGADCIKTGMLHNSTVIEIVIEQLTGRNIPLVIDPVMVSSSGRALLAKKATADLKSKLMPMAAIVTPNIPEAETLVDRELKSVSAMKDACKRICEFGCDAVLLKGGHMAGDTLTDVFYDGRNFEMFEGRRIDTPHTHGTGCTLASAIATGIALGKPMIEAVSRARDYVRVAIETAPRLGGGHGPLNHGHPFQKL